MAYAGFNKTLQTITFSYPVTMNSNISVPSGNVTNPSVSFISNTNTGIYRPAANTMAIVTAATERLRIDSAGRVGINCVPNAGLDVVTNVATTALSVSQSGSGALFTCSNASSKGMYILNNGNVGLGTTLPSCGLHINSSNAANVPNIIALPPVVILEERSSTGYVSPVVTDGMPNPPGWFSRVLNRVMVDGISQFLSPLTVSTNNQFRLPAGTYMIQAEAIAVTPDKHRIALYDTTTSTYVAYGSTEFTTVNSSIYPSTKSTLTTVITIPSTKIYELRHWILSYPGTGLTSINGKSATFGYAPGVSSGDDDTFARVIITKYQ